MCVYIYIYIHTHIYLVERHGVLKFNVCNVSLLSSVVYMLPVCCSYAYCLLSVSLCVVDVLAWLSSMGVLVFTLLCDVLNVYLYVYIFVIIG